LNSSISSLARFLLRLISDAPIIVMYWELHQLKKTRHFVRQKVGRPKAPYETVQVGLRLPKGWVEEFQRGRGVSKEIQERLARSIFDDATDPKLRELWGQIEQLAVGVRRAFGTEWHADQRAHGAFVETLKRWLADLERPTAKTSTLDVDPAAAAQIIYTTYVQMIEDQKQGRTVMRATARHELENLEGIVNDKKT
jgi:hypothetical protein